MKITITCLNLIEKDSHVEECKTEMEPEAVVNMRAQVKCPKCGYRVIVAC